MASSLGLVRRVGIVFLSLTLASCIFGLDAADSNGEGESDGGWRAGDDAGATLSRTEWVRQRLADSKWLAIIKADDDRVGVVYGLHLFEDGSVVFSGFQYHSGEWSLEQGDAGPSSVVFENLSAEDCESSCLEEPPEKARISWADDREISELKLDGGSRGVEDVALTAPGSDRLEYDDLRPKKWRGEEEVEFQGQVRTIHVALEFETGRVGSYGYGLVSAQISDQYESVPARIFDQAGETFWALVPEERKTTEEGTPLLGIGGSIEWSDGPDQSTLYAPFYDPNTGGSGGLREVSLTYQQ